MKNNVFSRWLQSYALLSVAISGHLSCATPLRAQQAAAEAIPAATITRLQADLTATAGIESTTSRRRAIKRVVRGAESVLQTSQEMPNRFLVWKIVFDGRKELFALQQTAQNRDALFAAAKQLAEAPDAYTVERLEADVLLTQAELATKEDSRRDYAVTVAMLADRYRGTKAEAQSLMFATRLALDVGYAPLVSEFRKVLSQRFSNSPQVGAFLMETFAERKEHFVRGVLERADGRKLSFPSRQTSVFCFWSTETAGFEERIGMITDLQTIYPDMPVYSFNLDRLRDAGEGQLEASQLDWIPVALEDGEEDEFYRLFDRGNKFCAAVVDTHGRATIQGSATKTIPGHLYWVIPLKELYETAKECPRRLAVRHSIYSGEFLVRDTTVPGACSVPTELLAEIQSLFTPAPRGYRVAPDKKLQEYARIDALCREAIAQHAGAPDIWRVWNARMVALMARWRLTGDSDYLDRAVAHAVALDTTKLPSQARVVAGFCIAARALLQGDRSPEETVAAFLRRMGGADASPEALTAALILAVQAHSGDLYVRYRDRLLAEHRDHDAISQLMVFLGAPGSAKALFEEALPRKGDALPPAPVAPGLFHTTLTTTNGVALRFPDKDGDGITALIFVETFPPPDIQQRMLSAMWHLSQRPLKDLRNVLVLRNLDPAPVAAFLKHRRLTLPVVNLTEEAWANLGRRLGVVAADLRPNVSLVHADGRILHVLSGMDRASDRSSGGRGVPYDWVLNAVRSIEGSLREYDRAFADAAWQRKDYGAYVQRLLTLFPPPYRRKSRWINESLVVDDHRRQVAWTYMQTEEWRKALDMVDRIHVLRALGDYQRGMHSQQDLYGYKAENDLMMRATLHEKLGRGRNAKHDRNKARELSHPFEVKRYDLHHTREACIERRKQARKHLDAEQWKEAAALVTRNIAVHEAEPERCRTSCRICVEQVDAMRYYAQALEEAGRKDDAASARVMVAAMPCPSWRPQERIQGFPVGRLAQEAGRGPRRLRYLRTYMRGGGRANRTHREYRLELGEDLWIRSVALAKTGQSDQADKDRKRSIALVWPLNPESIVTGAKTPQSYVTHVEVEESKWKE